MSWMRIGQNENGEHLEMITHNPPIRHAWEMTYDELLGELESLNSVVDREGLDRLRPLLAEVYPEYIDVDYRDYTQDPWGIGRAIQAGTEIPRAPTVDLSQRLRKLKEQHGIEHNPRIETFDLAGPGMKATVDAELELYAWHVDDLGRPLHEEVLGRNDIATVVVTDEFVGIDVSKKASIDKVVPAVARQIYVKNPNTVVEVTQRNPSMGNYVEQFSLSDIQKYFGVKIDVVDSNPPDAKTLIGTSEDGSLEFHLVNGDVYRVKAGWSPDAYGLPMGMRWECSLEHWNRYRNSAFSWVIAQTPSVSTNPRIDTSEAYKLFEPEKAEAVADDLRENDPDWTYVVKHDPKGTGKSFIEIYDEDGEYIGRF